MPVGDSTISYRVRLGSHGVWILFGVGMVSLLPALALAYTSVVQPT